MLLIYYRDKDGAICKHHAPPEALATPEKVREAAKAYNEGKGKEKGYTAYVLELEDDGLTAYLARKTYERRKFDKEVIEDAVSSIDDALEAVRGLGVWT